MDPSTVVWKNSNFKNLEMFDSFRHDCLKEGIGKVFRPNETDAFHVEFKGKVWKDNPERVMSIIGNFQSFQQFRLFKNACASQHIKSIINHSNHAFEVEARSDQYGGWFTDMGQFENFCTDIEVIKKELGTATVCGHKAEDGSFRVMLAKKREVGGEN